MSQIYKDVYPRFVGNERFYEQRIVHVCTQFMRNFDTQPRVFSAPGRTEIGGNHTDHQRGNVLCAAIDLDVLGAVAKNNTKCVNIISEGYPKTTVDISDLAVKEDDKNTFASLIRGIAARFSQLGYDVSGFDMYCTSLVLKGSGLSSSAAFEVLVGTVVNALFAKNALSAVEIAQVGQYAENVYFGKPSGLMDQTACSVGGIIAIDFFNKETPVVNEVDFDFANCGHSLVIIDSGADHADLTDEYSSIPFEMNKVARYFGKEVLSELDKSTLMSDIKPAREYAGDRAVLRAIHYFDDCEYAKKEAKCLNTGDFDGFLRLVTLSGISSQKHLQNITPTGAVNEQAVAYTLALCEEFLQGRGAYRVHGGGFAGTVQAFVPDDMLEEFVCSTENALNNGCCHVLKIRNAGGVELEVV